MFKRKVNFDDNDLDNNGEEIESEEEAFSTSEEETEGEGQANEETKDEQEEEESGLALSDLSDEDEEPVEVDNEEELRQKNEKQREDMRLMIQNFSEEQLHRYETFRRAGFPKASIKKLVQSVIDQPVNPNMIIAISGIAKVFVGELVEESRRVSKDWNDEGQLLPSHVLEAYRRMKKDNVVPASSLHRKDVRYY